MKKLLRVALLVLAAPSVARAQDDRTVFSQAEVSVATGFANNSPASFKLSDAISWPSAERRFADSTWLAEPRSLAAPAEAVPAAPEPKFVFGSRDDFRWQLALGVSVLRFRSSIYYATGVGTNTAVTYFTNEWFGAEGSIITAHFSWCEKRLKLVEGTKSEQKRIPGPRLVDCDSAVKEESF